MIGTGGTALLSVDARDLIPGDLTDDGFIVVGVRQVHGVTVVEYLCHEPRLYQPGNQVLIHDDRF